MKKLDIQVSDLRETPRRSVFGGFPIIHVVCREAAKNLQRRRSDCYTPCMVFYTKINTKNN